MRVGGGGAGWWVCLQGEAGRWAGRTEGHWVVAVVGSEMIVAATVHSCWVCCCLTTLLGLVVVPAAAMPVAAGLVAAAGRIHHQAAWAGMLLPVGHQGTEAGRC